MSEFSTELEKKPHLEFGTEVRVRESKNGVVIHTRNISQGLVAVALRYNGGLSPQLSSEHPDTLQITGQLTKAETLTLLRLGVLDQGLDEEHSQALLNMLSEYEDDLPYIL